MCWTTCPHAHCRAGAGTCMIRAFLSVTKVPALLHELDLISNIPHLRSTLFLCLLECHTPGEQQLCRATHRSSWRPSLSLKKPVIAGKPPLTAGGAAADGIHIQQRPACRNLPVTHRPQKPVASQPWRSELHKAPQNPTPGRYSWAKSGTPAALRFSCRPARGDATGSSCGTHPPIQFERLQKMKRKIPKRPRELLPKAGFSLPCCPGPAKHFRFSGRPQPPAKEEIGSGMSFLSNCPTRSSHQRQATVEYYYF